MNESNMFYGAHPVIFQKAEELRNKMTHSEELLWNYLNHNEWNLKFRRQHPISIYIVDFYCHKLKLVIEIDGSVHDSEEAKLNDEKRQNDLENLNLTVIRFTNNQVKNEIELVIEKIFSTIEKITANKELST